MNNNIGDAGALALSVLLQKNPSIYKIHLTDNNIGALGIIAINEALADKSGIDVVLDENNFEEITTIKNKITDIRRGLALENPRIEEKLDDADIIILAYVLRNTRIRYNSFSITNNKNMGDDAFLALTTAFNLNIYIRKLHLDNNDLGDKVFILAEALKTNTHITQLSLSMNEISDTGAYHLAEALKTNTHITHLDLSNNNITSEGASYLKDALETNTKIKLINLHNNYINIDEFGIVYPHKFDRSKHYIDPHGRIIIGPQKPSNVIAQIKALQKVQQDMTDITNTMRNLRTGFRKRSAPKRKAQGSQGQQGQQGHLEREFKKLKIQPTGHSQQPTGHSQQATDMQVQNV